MPKPTISAEGAAALKKLNNDRVADGTLPVMYLALANEDGIFYSSHAGPLSATDPSKGAVTDETMLQLFSMTKLVTSIACLQLWEKGLVDFDDPALIEKHLPELAKQPILLDVTDDGEVKTAPRTKPLTLRHMLTHTSGLGYNFSSPLLAKWEAATKAPSWLKPRADVDTLVQPLLFEPGSRYLYSIGPDWAGILVSRITGQSLEDYFHEHIFRRCGVKDTDITFFPTDDVKRRLTSIYTRTPAGKVVPFEGLRPLQQWTPEDVVLQMGGAGLLGTPTAYLTLLYHLLRCKDSDDGVVSPKVYKMLFTNALPPRAEAAQVYSDLGGMGKFEGMTESQFTDGSKAAHSLGLFLNEADSVFGRKSGSGWWAGAAKTRYWLDPTTGLAVFFGTQILEFNWEAVGPVVDEVEKIVYEHLVV